MSIAVTRPGQSATLTQSTYDSLTGHRATIRCPNAGDGNPWSAAVSCTGALGAFVLVSVRAGTFAHLAAVDAPSFVASERYSLQDGELLLGSRELNDPSEVAGLRSWTASWEGNRFALLTWLRAGPDPMPIFLERLNAFDLEETARGIVAHPRLSNLDFFGDYVTTDVPKLGIVDILPIDEGRSLLPPWEGTTVAGGELFAGDHVYVLASTSAVAVISPREVAAEDSLSSLEQTEVVWT